MTISSLFGVVLAAVGRDPEAASRTPDDLAKIDDSGRAASALGGAARGGISPVIPASGTMFVARLPRRAAVG